MSGEKNRKMQAPVLVNFYLEANMIHQLDRKAKALTKKHGFRVYRSDIVRMIIKQYLEVSGG